jgi:DNA-binding CsgD family transcriptional regulator
MTSGRCPRPRRGPNAAELVFVPSMNLHDRAVPRYHTRVVSAGARYEMIGRDEELAVVERVLAGFVPAPRGVLIEGEAGMGKTTLWLEGVRMAEARGFRVLQARPAESEAQLSYAALTDVLGGVFDESADALPPPQRQALAAALLRTSADPEIDERTTATAVSSVLEALAARPDVLVAIDDVQWLDPASARALTFALRRAPARVATLLARRSGAGAGPMDVLERKPASLEHVRLGPLSLAALHHLIAVHLGRAPARPALARIAGTAGGNPFFSLELARALAAAEDERTPADPLPLPQSLQAALAARLRRLSEPTRDVLAAASALSKPSPAALAAALGADVDLHGSLSEAEEASVVESTHERIRFTHPLLASVLYASLTAERRRSLHRRLATVVSDREERARHLALGAAEPDEAVAGELEEAGRAAARRGAQDAAAELFELACHATPGDRVAELARRLLAQATALLVVGDVDRSRVLAEQATSLAEATSTRARAASVAASADWSVGDAARARQRLEEALAEPGLARELRGELTAKLARYGVLDDPRRAESHALEAVELLSEERAPRLVAGALIDCFFASVLLGRGADDRQLRRALELERRGPAGARHPIPMVWLHFTDAFDEARARYAEEDAEARERGWEEARLDRLAHLAMAELYAGHCELAARHADESCAMATVADARGPTAMRFAFRALVDAHRGRTERARSTIEAVLDRFERDEQAYWAAMTLSVIGFVEFAEGRYEEADAALARMRELVAPSGVKEAPLERSERFHVEALCALGRLDDARSALARLEWRHETLPRPWTAVALPRARAELLAAEGDVTGALDALDALDLDLARRLPFELAWTQLLRGRLLRRTKQKRAAAETLREALQVFEQLGAPVWSARARDELARVGLRHRPSDELTVSEHRVAELAASGLTNREIAAVVFMSPKTVEANLGRVYRKLGIRSRAELGARMAAVGEGGAAET